MGKGVSKRWTPEAEERYNKRLASCQTFAERHLIMTIWDIFKYDGRTKEGRKAIAQGRLRLATATDKDLQEIAELEQKMPRQVQAISVSEKVEELKELRARIRARGIKRSELESPEKPEQ